MVPGRHRVRFGFHDSPAPFLRTKICAWQKHLAHRNQLTHVRFVAGAAYLVVKEGNRDLHVNTRAIACFRIRPHGATMTKPLKYFNPFFDYIVRCLAIKIADESHAAIIMFIARIIQSLFLWKMMINHGVTPR